MKNSFENILQPVVKDKKRAERREKKAAAKKEVAQVEQWKRGRRRKTPISVKQKGESGKKIYKRDKQAFLEEYREDFAHYDHSYYEKVFGKESSLDTRKVSACLNDFMVWEMYAQQEDYLRKKGRTFDEAYQDPVLKTEIDLIRRISGKRRMNVDDDFETMQKYLLDLERRLDSKVLAGKAIELMEKFFILEDDEDGRMPFDINWIYSASAKLIEEASEALENGETAEQVFQMAVLRYVMGDDVELTDKLIREFDGDYSKAYRINDISKFAYREGIEIYPEEYLKLSTQRLVHIKKSFQAGYTLDDIIAHPWLASSVSHQLQKAKDGELPKKFPVGGKEKVQKKWCVQNAFYIPEGWNHDRLGNVILMRLSKAIDHNLHDATHWLSEFEYPEETPEGKLKDFDTEVELLHSILDVPDRIKGKISTKKSKYSEYFSSEATQFVYESIIPLFKKEVVSMPVLSGLVSIKLSEYKKNPRKARSLKASLPEFEEQVEFVLEKLSSRLVDGTEPRLAPLVVEDLKAISQSRTTYIDTAQKWISTHAQTPRSLLIYAWNNRSLALSEGVDDNPRAIETWAKLNSLKTSFDHMEELGILPENITKADLKIYESQIADMLQHYDGETIIRFIAWYKENLNEKQIIAPEVRHLQKARKGEILKKDDLRGATIGADTGCCMTLGGASEDCINEGFSNPNTGFFTIRKKDDELIAQSFIWVNTEKASDTLVLDNIEVNQGRDMGKVLDSYIEYFEGYLKDQKRKNPDFNIRKVYVGTGYSSIGLGKLKDVKSIPIPYEGYTDSDHQKLLVEIPEEDFGILA